MRKKQTYLAKAIDGRIKKQEQFKQLELDKKLLQYQNDELKKEISRIRNDYSRVMKKRRIAVYNELIRRVKNADTKGLKIKDFQVWIIKWLEGLKADIEVGTKSDKIYVDKHGNAQSVTTKSKPKGL